MAALIWVNIGSGNGLLPHSTKPLLESMFYTSNVFYKYEMVSKLFNLTLTIPVTEKMVFTLQQDPD